MLEQILLRARLQLLGKAYIHHFERYGVTADFLSERAELVQTVIDDYEAARLSCSPHCSSAGSPHGGTSGGGGVCGGSGGGGAGGSGISTRGWA